MTNIIIYEYLINYVTMLWCGLNTIFLVKKNEYISFSNMFFNIKNFYL
jgi:hypothetical protein